MQQMQFPLPAPEHALQPPCTAMTTQRPAGTREARKVVCSNLEQGHV